MTYQEIIKFMKGKTCVITPVFIERDVDKNNMGLYEFNLRIECDGKVFLSGINHYDIDNVLMEE